MTKLWRKWVLNHFPIAPLLFPIFAVLLGDALTLSNQREHTPTFISECEILPLKIRN